MHIQSGLTPLHLAAQEDKVNVAEVLLNHGADINAQTKVKLSQIVYTHVEIIYTDFAANAYLCIFLCICYVYQCIHGIGKILSDTPDLAHTRLESSQVLHK